MNEITDSELDVKMAWLMDWHLEARAIGQEGWCNSDGDWQIDVRDWHPSTDLNQAWQVEERIKELGLWLEYCGELIVIEGKRQWWDIVHVTARQRCLAALQVKK